MRQGTRRPRGHEGDGHDVGEDETEPSPVDVGRVAAELPRRREQHRELEAASPERHAGQNESKGPGDDHTHGDEYHTRRRSGRCHRRTASRQPDGGDAAADDHVDQSERPRRGQGCQECGGGGLQQDVVEGAATHLAGEPLEVGLDQRLEQAVDHHEHAEHGDGFAVGPTGQRVDPRVHRRQRPHRACRRQEGEQHADDQVGAEAELALERDAERAEQQAGQTQSSQPPSAVYRRTPAW